MSSSTSTVTLNSEFPSQTYK